MVNIAARDKILNLFRDSVQAHIDENLAGVNLKEQCANGDMDIIRATVRAIESSVIAAIPAGIGVPKASLYINGTGDGQKVTVLSLSLTSGWKDAKKFKYSIKLPVDDGIMPTISDFMKESYEDLLGDIIAAENLTRVNELLNKLTAEAGVNYTIQVVTPTGNNCGAVQVISDTEAVFVVDMNRIFEIDDIMALAEPNELITEEMIADAQKKLADEIGLCQTTPQLVGKHGGSFLKHLCKIGTQVKAITLIGKTVSKNAEKLTGKNDTRAYFRKDKVYAILDRVDGNLEVSLSPFNVDTLMNEDFDVLSAIQ